MGGAIFNMQGSARDPELDLRPQFGDRRLGGASNRGQGLGGAVFNLSGTVTADGATFAEQHRGSGRRLDLQHGLRPSEQPAGTDDHSQHDRHRYEQALLVSDFPIFTASGLNTGSATADVS